MLSEAYRRRLVVRLEKGARRDGDCPHSTLAKVFTARWMAFDVGSASTCCVLNNLKRSGLASRDDVGAIEGPPSSVRDRSAPDSEGVAVFVWRAECPSKIAKSHVENGAVNGDKLRISSSLAQVFLSIGRRR